MGLRSSWSVLRSLCSCFSFSPHLRLLRRSGFGSPGAFVPPARKRPRRRASDMGLVRPGCRSRPCPWPHPPDEASLRSAARMDDGMVRAATRCASAARAEKNGRLLERLGLVVAAGLGVAVFFGGWQLPGGVEARSTVLQAVAALLFVAKTW